jgi:hypothetical protein
MSEMQPGNDRTQRAITAGLSATGAAAGVGGLAYAAHDAVNTVRAGKKIPLKTKALIPLETAGLAGEVMATKILHNDAKRDKQLSGNVAKRDFSAGQRRKLASKGDALPDGSFPIKNRSDLANAKRLVGRSKHPEEAREFIARRESELSKAMSRMDVDPKNGKGRRIVVENAESAEENKEENSVPVTRKKLLAMAVDVKNGASIKEEVGKGLNPSQLEAATRIYSGGGNKGARAWKLLQRNSRGPQGNAILGSENSHRLMADMAGADRVPRAMRRRGYTPDDFYHQISQSTLRHGRALLENPDKPRGLSAVMKSEVDKGLPSALRPARLTASGLRPPGKSRISLMGNDSSVRDRIMANHNGRLAARDQEGSSFEGMVSRSRSRDKFPRPSKIGKARYFDPEADRQRRLGLYSGAALGGAIAAGSVAHSKGEFGFEREAGDAAKKMSPKYTLRANRKGVAAAGASLGLAALAAGTYKRGISHRNQPWN